MEEESGSESPVNNNNNNNNTAVLAIALPAQNATPMTQNTTPMTQQYNNNNRSSNGGAISREDCWSEKMTGVLIEAWGERYLQLSRGNLKQNHWKDVSDSVASQEDPGKVPKTDVQCKNRIDTVKKKFKAEKAKIAAGGGPSLWPFFDRMDYLIGPTIATPNPPGSRGGNSIQSEQFLSGSGLVRSARIQNQKLKRRRSNQDSDSDPDPPSDDSADSLPPETMYPYKRPRTQREFSSIMNPNFDHAVRPQSRERERGDPVRELTRAIVKLGEMYEKAERAKVQQMVEMEKQRMTFDKELEMQRLQFFTKTQLEFLQSWRSSRNRNNNHRNNHHVDNSYANNVDNNHHSDSSV